MDSGDLPIFELEPAICDGFAGAGRVIIQAPTGSGKSTQAPQMLLDHDLLGNGQVVILQPRRLATRMLAARVAVERGVRLGDEVGYQIRFDDVSSSRTRIKFVTEGILLRRMLGDPTLGGISAILFDEFHERHLYGDITLARALQLQETVRPDLKIGVMSATLATELLEKYLQPCRVLRSAGRTFPVTMEYLPKPMDPAHLPIWEAAAREWERLATAQTEGDALIFMPGAYEIQRTIEAIRASPVARGWTVLPLHGELPAAQQDAAVARYDCRKAIVSTNVAETSLTIDGVRLVIDSGLARVARYDPHRGINTLLVEKISRASADQRMGRAGRTAPGHCARLWTEQEHRLRSPQELPEVKRLDLSEVVLTLKASGVTDVKAFRWLEAPEARSLERAEALLTDLGALDSTSGAITEIGRRMLSFPVHPRYSRMLLAADELRCVRPVALIAALTQGRSLWMRGADRHMDAHREEVLGGEAESDFFILMRAWRHADQSGYNLERCKRLGIHAGAARQVRPLFERFLDIAREEGIDIGEHPVSDEAIQRCLLLGFSDHLARRVDGGTLRCALVHGRSGTLARDSVVRDKPLLVAAEVEEVQRGGLEVEVILRFVTAVREEWLRGFFPGDFRTAHEVFYDNTTRRVMAREQTLFRGLALESKMSDRPPPEAAAAILTEEVLKGACPLKHWDDAVEQWILRVNRLSEWCPDLGITAIGEADRRTMIQQICLGATSYKEIKEKPVLPVVKAWLSPAGQEWMEKHAPGQISLPKGRKTRITYAKEGPPTIAARIQDLYGVQETLAIARGRVPLVIQVLAPNHRPVQITQNLAIFWRETYPKIKQELQRKYPRHEWR